MPMTAEAIVDAIQTALPDAAIELTDLAGDNDHYAVKVASASFAGLSRVAQHKKVMEALGGRMGGELHALSIVTSVK
jgi:stress-induced morphogen